MARSPGTMPSVISGNCSEALAIATTPWQRSASSSPPPSAMPLSAATTGLRMRSMCSKSREQSRAYCAAAGTPDIVRNAPDTGPRREGARSIAGDDKAGHRGIILEPPDHNEDFVSQLIVQRVERLGTPDGDDFDIAQIIHQHEAKKILVIARGTFRQRQARPFFCKALADTGHFRRAKLAHQFQRPRFETKRQAATELEVRRAADAAIENIAALRHQDAEQAVANRRRNLRRDRHGLARR